MNKGADIEKRKSEEVPMGDYVPFAAHIAPNVIKLRNGGGLTATWRVQGISFETAEPADIRARHNQLNNSLSMLAGGHYAIYHHKIGRVVKDRLDAKYDNAFCADFNERYNNSLDSKRMFLTELYFTVVYRPSLSKVIGLFKSVSRTPQEVKDTEQQDLEEFQMVCAQVLNSLQPYDPTRLSTYTKNSTVYSEQLRLFGYILNSVWEDVPLRTAGINEYLPSSRLFFGDRNGMAEIRNVGVKKFAGILDFQEYPSTTEPGMNNAIFYGDYEYVETHSFAIMNKRDALKSLDMQMRRLIASDDAAASEIGGIEYAQDLVTSGEIQMGEYHFSLMIFAGSTEKLVKQMASAKSALEDGPGYRVAVGDVVPEAAWYAQLPGNWWMRPRQASITSRNFAAMAPLHNFPSGKREGNPWGQCIALLESPSGQPFFFNFHVSPPKVDSIDEKLPGNTTVLGTTGVGKTTLVMALLAFATKVQGLRAVFFDKDRGAEIGIRAMGGNYRSLKFGERTGFNPFQFERSKTNIEFCKKLVAMLVTRNGEVLTSKEEENISTAVETVFENDDMKLRRLAAVDQNLSGVGENSLRQRLKKWVGHGDYAWVLDNPRDTTDLSNGSLFGFDYTEFLDRAEVRTPIMAYLLHVTETLINGQPFIYFMEEFWKPLMDAYFTDFALNKQKTIRKQNGLGVFMTQSPSDLLRNGVIGKTMVEQSVTQIFLPNPRADHDEYVNEFKLTEQEYQVLVNLSENSRMFLVKQNSRSALVRMNLAGMPDVINVLSGATDNVELLERVLELTGDDPDVWLPKFHEAIHTRKQKITLNVRP